MGFKRIGLFLVLSLLINLTTQAANYYWRSTAVNNLFTNVGNWEVTPGGSISPGVAPSSNDSVFFPVTSSISTINLNGGNCGVFTVSAPTTFTFTGSGNFYGDINANGNILFSNAGINLQGLAVKNINLDPNPGTLVYYFLGGSIVCNSGTVNLTHNLFTSSTLNLTNTLTQFNSNSFDINCGNLRIGNAASAVYDLSNSRVRTTNITYYTTNAANLNTVGTRFVLSRASGNVFYGYGNAPLTFQALTIEGAGGIDWYGNGLTIKIDSLTIQQASAFDINNVSGATWYVDSVLILEKHTSFLASRNLTINMFLNRVETPSLCEGQSTFKNFRINTISPITINTVAFKNINFLGVGLTSSSSNNVINNGGAAITWTGPLLGQTFHWVGGNGDWNDPTEWSLLGSGGVPQLAAGCVPTYADSVVFDDNSFTTVGEVVNTVSLQAKCRSITNIDSGNEGGFNGGISISGNVNFTGASAVNSIELVGKGNHTITSGSNFAYSGYITINAEGSYVLTDSILSNSNFYHSSGGLDFNGNNVDVNYFNSSTANGVLGGLRTLDFSNCVLRTNSGLYIGTGKLSSVDATNSVIYIENPSGQARFGTGQAPVLPVLQLNDLYFTAATGTASIYSNNINVRFNDIYYSSHGIASYGGYTANTLNLAAGKIYSFYPRAGWRFTILSGINTTITSCGDLATLKSTDNNQFDLYKSTLPFTTDGLIVQGANSTGAALTVNNGVDLGNNTNVVVAAGVGRDMYWVNNGGNWNDGFGHWSIGVSGGNPAITNPSGCIPRPIDNVFFDTNSFTIAGQTVTLNVDASCNDMIWDTNAASFTPALLGANTTSLNVYGSLRFSTGMIHNHTGYTIFRGVGLGVNSQTIHTDDVLIRTQMYFSGGGRYDIIHDMTGSTTSRFFFNVGHLYTNSYDITVGIMYLELPTTNSADISNSNINLTVYTGYRANHYSTTNFNANGSSITVPQYFYPDVRIAFTDTIQYNNVRITGGGALRNNRVITSPVSFNKVQFGNNNAMDGTFIIDTLIYTQSTVNTLDPAGFYSILDTLIADGTPCVPITLRSSVVNTPANIKSSSCNFDVQFGNAQDLTADVSSGCVAVDYKVFGNDAGGNLNWNFIPPPSTNQLGVDSIIYCTDAPYTISTDGFGKAPATYLWNTGETTKTIDIDTGGIYYVQVTYTAGCVASDTILITVLDTVAPILACPLDSIVFLDNACQYILGDFTDSIAVDDCTPDSAIISTQNPIAGTVFNGESIQIIWLYAEDKYGNTDSCSFQLTISDSTNPLIVCKDTSIYLAANGQYIIDTSFIFTSASGNCGIDSVWTNDTLFTCANIGLNTATLYARDLNGNVDSCTANVIVLDTLTPMVICKDTTVYLSALGQVNIDTSFIYVSSVDNCSVDSIWITSALFTCSDIGINNTNIYVRDVNGNIDSCSSTVTVLDTLNSIIVCKDTTVYLSAGGVYNIDTSYVYVSSSDNCGVDSIWITNTNFTCIDTGVNNVPVFVRDVNGNLDSCITIVTVLDTIKPVISCPGNLIVCEGAVVNWVAPVPSDNCGILSLTSDYSPGSVMPVGVNTVTYVATDLSGNVDSCSFIVTVNAEAALTDFHIAKVRSCEDTVYNTLSFMVTTGSFPVNYWFYNATDTIVSGTVNSLDSVVYFDSLTLPQGSYNIVLSNPDGCGTDSIIQIDNSVEPLLVDSLWAPNYVCYQDSGSIYVRIKDGVGPYDYYLFNSNNDTVSFIQATTDTVVVFNNLPPDNYTMDIVDFGQVDWHHQIGGSLRERGSMFQDSSGNVFLIGGTESPEYTLGSPLGGIDGFLIKIDKDGHIKWRKRYGTSGLDYLINMKQLSNGDFVLLGYKKGFFISQLYTNHDCDAWLIRIDSNGNVLKDTTYGGTIYDQPRDVVELANGDLVIVGGSRSNNGDFVGNHGGLEDGFIMRTDGNLNLQWTRLVGSTGQDGLSSINLLPNGELLSIGWCGGNNGDVLGYHGGGMDAWIVKFDQNGNILNQKAFGGSGYDYLVYNKTDVNYIYSMGLTGSSNGDIAIPGYGSYDGLAVRFNILDDSIDKVYKVGTPQYDEINSFVPTNDGGFYTAGTITNASLDGWLAKFDSTGALENSQIIGGTIGNSYYGSQYEGLSTILNSNDGFYLVAGSYHSPNGTFTGNHGLEDVLAFKLGVKYCEVINVTIPEIPQIHDTVNRIICQGDSSSIGPNYYNSSGTYIDTIIGYLGCDSIVTLNLQVDSFVTQTVDTMICNGQTMTLHGSNYLTQGVYNDTVLNSNGCDSICYTLNLFVDTVPPVASCKDTIVYLNNIGNVIINSSYVNNNSSDNCSGLTITLSRSTFGCADVGLNTVTVYVTDNNSNIDSCTATVTILDTLNPIITCNDTTIYLNSSGQVTIDTSYIFTNATDNCGIDSVWINDTLFTCVNTGINTATIYARDVNGNIDSCTATVTVLDSVNPVVICKDTTIYLNTLGQYIIDTSYIHVSNSDNCAVDSIWTNDTLYDCSNIGTSQATIYVRDVSGNISSCMANVTVIDSINPIIVCNDTTIYLSPAGNYTIDTSYVLANLSDNCVIDTVWLTLTSFTCSDTGVNIVTIYARDVNNNLDSCTASVTVLDTVNPTVSCMNATIYLDTNGQFIIDTSYVYSSSFAGCGLDSIWIADSVFDCSQIGLNTVSVYARDINGNIDSCQAQVTVLDTITPIITCGTTLYDTVSNFCEYIVPDFRDLTLPTDNCTDSINFQITQVPSPGTVITVQNQFTQNIVITVIDTNGNQSVCMFDVDLTCKDKFQIPEFISPNGDGKNDTWIITGIEDYPNNLVKIFNRQGALVYEKSGYQNTWDGTANVDYIFQAGTTDNILPSGTYFFILELDINDENSEVYTRMIQLHK